MRILWLCFWATVLLFPLLSVAQAPLSQRVVQYDIDAKYDAQAHSVDAVETLTWRNFTGKPQDTFPFHLYLNAFQPHSTFNEETRRRGGFREGLGGATGKREGSIVVRKFDVVSMGDGKSKLVFPSPQDVTNKIKFAQPDDGNPNDRTVIEVPLPQPIPPGGEVTFRIAFHDQFPEVVARTGYKRDFILAGQWFPKIGAWWKNAWNCHQFHENSEFFSDFGVYNVNITLPRNFVDGATGAKVAEKNDSDGTKTVTYHAEDVHDFAWTADPNYKVLTDTFTNSAGNKTAVRILMQPDHMGMGERYRQVTLASLKKFDEWYGHYPYSTLTVVDPASGAEQAGGMEYPTFITGLSVYSMPKGIKMLPEGVVEHEFGHQYWYAMVATNEFEDAWLDEGINSYTEVKVLAALYGKDTDVVDLLGATLGDASEQRDSYLGSADLDPMTSNAWDYVTSNSYGAITYGKTATVLLTLESIIGEQKMQQAVRTWFERYKFTHPTEEDFMNTVNQVAGQDLSWYWNQAVKGTQVLDYRILNAKSFSNDWKSAFAKQGTVPLDTVVVVHRKGEFIMPVHLQVKFDNGDVENANWDGKERWHRFEWHKNARFVSAEIDPSHQVLLDKDRFNNSYLAEPDGKATRKITAYWMILTQWFGQMLAWLT
ncbi:MAG TPA: M1 family metallopeptidase [Terriglobales bacterium]|nr:M1 family metallopeptidase [Terriglobales bacterium]